MMLEQLRQQYLEQPFEVSLETLAVCNAKCNFCPYPTLERKGTRMDDSHIHFLLEQMADWKTPFFISPFKVNEPFLDKRMIALCQIAERSVPNARLRLFTNGSPLTPYLVDQIQLLGRVEHLWISLNSHESAEYERIMQIPFAHTARNLDHLHNQIASAEFPHMVVVSKVVAKAGTADKFIEYCHDRWPMFHKVLIKQDGWLGYVPPVFTEIPNTPCLRWFELSILATGEASLCCMDGKGEFIIGNTHTDLLIDIYNSPQWRDRRERMISRKEIHPCSTCTY
jgi:sulfatase maturation enzyme AslB (radical SAM superfamily)